MAIKHVLAAFILPLIVLACTPKPDPYRWEIPEGFPAPIEPLDNPMTEAKVELGRKLFYDVNLSANQQQSCASCHQQQYAFAEPLALSVGSTGQVNRRNAQSLVNVAYNRTLTWAHSELEQLEQQILIPMFGETPVELGITGHEAEVLRRFESAQYASLFNEAFGDKEPTFDRIVKSLASFVRSLVSLNSAFDRYAYQGQDDALNESQIRGLNLFFSEQLECHHCHGGFNFTQSSVHEKQLLDLRPFHNTGMYDIDGKGAYPESDTGLIEVTLQADDMGKFRAPTLRNVAVSAPYMHDGSLKTLEAVIDFYAQGGNDSGRQNPFKSPFVKKLVISEQDKQDLINFLHSLTDKEFLTRASFAQPD